MTTARGAKRGLLSFILVLVLSMSSPLAVFADTTTPTDTTNTSTTTQPTDTSTTTTTPPPTDTSTTTTPPASTSPDPSSSTTTTPPPTTTTGSSSTGATGTGSTNTGPKKPNGDSANTFTYNEATGLWENDYYTWNPKTKVTTPKTPQTYSYNPTTDHWDTTQYQYNAATGKYEPNVYSTVGPLAALLSGNSPNGTTSNTNSAYNGFFNAAISNNLTTTALSGNAFVGSNTNVGNVATGNALAIANIINLLQSSASFSGGNLATFALNIPTYTGDILINPALLGGLAVRQTVAPVSNLQVNNQNSGQINNDVTVAAGSGSVAVANNTNVGNVSTGNANAVANILNAVGSNITAGQSFVGVVNINGNLNGDILLPQGLLSTLIGSNAPSTNTATAITNNAVASATTVNNAQVNNNVTTDAASGNANVGNNTTVGNVGTGNASAALNNITLLNLTGKNVVGSDNLLVFVNVLGNWMGMIVNAPGATAASLGGGITQNTTSAQTTNSSASTTTDAQINNNVNVLAQSGDANVTDNTKVGNVSTGNATASANIGNLVGTNMNLSNWFGVLFINVFGTWDGWFGQDTAAGNPPVAPSTGSSNGGTTASAPAPKKPMVSKLTSAGTTSNGPRYSVSETTGDSTGSDNTGAVLGTTTDDTAGPSTTFTPVMTKHSHVPTWAYPAAGMLIAILLLTGEKLFSIRERRAALKVATA